MAQPLTVPRVAVASVLAPDVGAPPLLLLVEADGAVRLAAAASWADLDADRLQRSRQTAPLGLVDPFVRTEATQGRRPLESLLRWNEVMSSNAPVALEPVDPAPTPREAPGAEDTRGNSDPLHARGTMRGMTLRAPDVSLEQARPRTFDEALQAGMFDRAPALGDGAYALDVTPRRWGDVTPARVAQIAGVVVSAGPLEGLRVMVLVAPSASALRLIEIVRETRAVIAVSSTSSSIPASTRSGSSTSSACSPRRTCARSAWARGPRMTSSPGEVTASPPRGSAIRTLLAISTRS